MSSGYEDESPEKCRERRRQRMEKMRLSSIPALGSSSKPVVDRTESSDFIEEVKRCRMSSEAKDGVSSSSSGELEASPSLADAIELCASDELPVFGTMSVSGRLREMEDAFSVRMRLCGPKFCRRQPVHFFAVYDGHGGPYVAELCSEKLHAYLEEELMRVEETKLPASGDSGINGGTGGVGVGAGVEEEDVLWIRAMKTAFQRMDELALNTVNCECAAGQCLCTPLEAWLSGSTAVVAVLTPDRSIVANCGDSRAVLCRGGRAVPLSFDHKPNRPDERARIEACGSRVVESNGARVEGILAMSRALGDKFLKPVVTSEPEITITKRDPEDECLILASDGLWDVISSDLASEIVSRCLKDGSSATNMVNDEVRAFYPSRSLMAATLLTRLALSRKSSDNITVIVVDLKRSAIGV